jgi:hypothetical protein
MPKKQQVKIIKSTAPASTKTQKECNIAPKSDAPVKSSVSSFSTKIK